MIKINAYLIEHKKIRLEYKLIFCNTGNILSATVFNNCITYLQRYKVE